MENLSFEETLKLLLAQDDWDSDDFNSKIWNISGISPVNLLQVVTGFADILENLSTNPVIRARAAHWLNEYIAMGDSMDYFVCERIINNPQEELVQLFLDKNIAYRMRDTEIGVAAILAANELNLLQNLTFINSSYTGYDFKVLRWIAEACYKGSIEISVRARVVMESYKHYAKEILRERYSQTLIDILTIAGINIDTDEIALSYEVWQAIANNNWESLCDYDAKIVPELLNTFDEIGAYRAYDVRQAIRNLTQADAQEAVCRVFISDNPRWLEAEDMRAAGYRPTGLLPFEQALFYFLTGEYEAYDAVDFNRQMLKTTYGVANNETRRRILEAVRESGQVEYLDIIKGQADGTIGRKEANIMVGTLVQHRRWTELWRLAIELPPLASIEAVQALPQGGWQVGDKVAQELFKRLKILVKNNALNNLAELPLNSKTYVPWLNEPLKDSGAWLLRLDEINKLLAVADVEPSIRAVLQYIKTILQHYYRDAIEISDDLKILTGETDIEIED
jgi:hypothetical protein